MVVNVIPVGSGITTYYFVCGITTPYCPYWHVYITRAGKLESTGRQFAYGSIYTWSRKNASLIR